MTAPDQPDQRPHKATIYVLKTLVEGSADKPTTVRVTDLITVQFNPTSLKIERSNNTSSGSTTGAQRRQQANEGHAVLSLDLEFDTAEGGPDGNPLDVRLKTAEIRQFVEPPKDKTKSQHAPPRLRFVWGKLVFDGIVTRVSEDLDYFSPEGLALRAKVSLSITEQDLKFERNASGAPARTDSATRPGGGQGSTGPNAPPTGNPDKAFAAQDGESLQQLLSRLGLDPETWRTAMAGLDSPLSLTAGSQVQLSADAAAGVGIGESAGFSAGLSASAGISAGAGVSADAAVTAAAGLSAGAAVGVGAGISAGANLDVAAGLAAGGAIGISAEAAAGFTLSAAGGVAASIGRALSRDVDAALARARGAFAVPGGDVDGGVTLTATTELSASASGSVSASVSATAAASASVDPRAVSYGQGVPLRPRPIAR